MLFDLKWCLYIVTAVHFKESNVVQKHNLALTLCGDYVL